MATISNVTTAISTTSGATLDLTGITAAVGDWLVLACGADNAGAAGVSSTSATVTDAAGNTWTRRSVTNNTPGGVANDGTTLSVWTCPVTNALSSATITINFSPNTTSKAAVLKKIAPGTGETIAYASVGAGATGTSTTMDAPTVSVPQGSTIIGVAALQDTVAGAGDADTTNGSWSTDHTAAANNAGSPGLSASVGWQHKTVTATGNQDYGRTRANARVWAANYLILGTIFSATLAVAGTATVAGAAPSFGTSGNTTIATAGAADIQGAAPSFATSDNAIVKVRRAGRILIRGYRPTVLPDNETIPWPAMLPSPRLETHAFVPKLDVSRTEMEQGSARQRRNGTAPTMTEAPFSMVCNQAQMAVLEAWVDHVVDYGGQWFVIDLLCAAGYEVHTVRLMGEPEYKELKRDRWMVTGTFEMEERPMLDESLLQLYDDGDTDLPPSLDFSQRKNSAYVPSVI